MNNKIAKKLNSTPVITTAAEVNKTIAVDLVGKEFGWQIDNDSSVTKVSAFMVNEEKIGLYQDTGEKNWWEKDLPRNVITYKTLDDLKKSDSKGVLIITDKLVKVENHPSVIYRPKTLVVGVGLHRDTSKETIQKGLEESLKRYALSPKSIAKLVSIKKPKDVQGLIDAAKEMNIPLEYVEKEELAKVEIPNPSKTVESFEGTPSVSEAAAILVSKGELLVEKQKFPPNLTIAIARKKY